MLNTTKKIDLPQGFDETEKAVEILMTVFGFWFAEDSQNESPEFRLYAWKVFTAMISGLTEATQ